MTTAELEELMKLMTKYGATQLTLENASITLQAQRPHTPQPAAEAAHVAFSEPERPLDLLYKGMKKGSFDV